MKQIEHIEKQFPQKRKVLLHRLRADNWIVVGVDDSESDWALNEKWLIESTRENKGIALTLWVFKFEGVHDGVDRVVATPRAFSAPSPYQATPSIDFDTGNFERQLDCFMNDLHRYRTEGKRLES